MLAEYSSNDSKKSPPPDAPNSEVEPRKQTSETTAHVGLRKSYMGGQVLSCFAILAF